MNKFLTVFTTLIFAVCAAAATKPFVYDTQTGNAPALNKLYRDFYIYVDMAPRLRARLLITKPIPQRLTTFITETPQMH